MLLLGQLLVGNQVRLLLFAQFEHFDHARIAERGDVLLLHP